MFITYFNDIAYINGKGVKHMLLKKNNQSGATMMEMLAVLGIITMLGSSIISLVANVMDMFKQNLVVNQIRDLQKAISGRYRFEGNYEGLLKNKTPEEISAYLCSSKIASYDMCVNGELYHRMGDKMWIMPVENYDAEGNAYNDYSKYVLEVWGLTKGTCVVAAQINWYQQNKSDVYKIIINSGKASQFVVDMPYNIGEGSTTATFPIYPDQALKACNNDRNDIQWVFF